LGARAQNERRDELTTRLAEATADLGVSKAELARVRASAGLARRRWPADSCAIALPARSLSPSCLRRARFCRTTRCSAWAGTVATLLELAGDPQGPARAQFWGRVVQGPNLLGLTPDTLRAHARGLAREVGLSPELLQQLLLKHPRTLMYDPASLAAKLDVLAEGLGVSREVVVARLLLFATSNAYALAPETVLAKVDALQRLLQLSRATVARLVLAQPSLLAYSEAGLRDKVDALADCLAPHWSRELLGAHLAGYPSALTYAPARTRAYWATAQAYLAAHPPSRAAFESACDRGTGGVLTLFKVPERVMRLLRYILATPPLAGDALARVEAHSTYGPANRRGAWFVGGRPLMWRVLHLNGREMDELVALAYPGFDPDSEALAEAPAVVKAAEPPAAPEPAASRRRTRGSRR
jgi:hypothetical protein